MSIQFIKNYFPEDLAHVAAAQVIGQDKVDLCDEFVPMYKEFNTDEEAANFVKYHFGEEAQDFRFYCVLTYLDDHKINAYVAKYLS